MSPTKSMIGAADQAVWFDAAWTINSRRVFQKAVKAMIEHAMIEDRTTDGS